MPWREVIFTDAGVVYPVTWDMHPQNRDKVKAKVRQQLIDSASLPDKPKFHFPSFSDFAEDGDSTSKAGSPAAMSIATPDIFSRRDAAPASSVLRTDKRAALPAETSPCSILRTERKHDPRLQSSSPICFDRQPQNGCSSPVAILNRTRLYWTVRSTRPVRRAVEHKGAPPTSPVNRFEDNERVIACSCEDDTSSFSGDDTLTPSACSGGDLKVSEVLVTKVDTVD